MIAHAQDVDKAYKLNFLYTNELWANTSGGQARGAEDLHNLDVTLEVDTGKAFGLRGGVLHLEGFYAPPAHFSEDKVDALQEVGNIDTSSETMWRLYQAYYEQDLGKTNVRFGIYDIETEFSNTKPLLLFLSKDFTWNSALDLSGTMSQARGTIGPGNFPYTPLALRVRHNFTKDWSAQVVVADGVSDDPEHPTNNAVILSPKYGALVIGEVDYQPSRYTKLMAGAWANTALLPTVGPGPVQGQTWGDQGGYVGGSTRLIHGEGRTGLDAFFTLGFGKSSVTSVDQSFNAGLVYTGLFKSRPGDKLGLAFNDDHGPKTYLQSLVAEGAAKTYSHQYSLELTYRAHVLNDWVTLQPDVQYIVHPGLQHQNSLVVGLHFEISNLFNF